MGDARGCRIRLEIGFRARKSPGRDRGWLLVVSPELLFDLQIVGDGEDSEDAVRHDVGDVPGSRVGDHSFKSDVAVLDDDAYRRVGAEGVPVHGGLSVDRAGNRNADLVVEGREWQYLNLVVHAGDPFELCHALLGLGLQCRARYLSVEVDSIALD